MIKLFGALIYRPQGFILYSIVRFLNWNGWDVEEYREQVV